MSNPWLDFVKKERPNYPHLTYKELLKELREPYMASKNAGTTPDADK